jgi:hypothetical protein
MFEIHTTNAAASSRITREAVSISRIEWVATTAMKAA